MDWQNTTANRRVYCRHPQWKYLYSRKSQRDDQTMKEQKTSLLPKAWALKILYITNRAVTLEFYDETRDRPVVTEIWYPTSDSLKANDKIFLSIFKNP